MSIKLLGTVASYLFTFLVSTKYGAEVMGTFALSVTIITIFSVIGRLGLDTALLKLVSEYSSSGNWGAIKGVYSTALQIVTLASISITILLFIGAPYLSKHLFHKEGLTTYIRLASIGTLPMTLLFINSEVLRGMKKIIEYAFLQHACIYIFGSFGLYIAQLYWQNGRIPLLIFLVSLVMVAIISDRMVTKRVSHSSAIREYRLSYNAILDISLPMLLTGSMLLVMSWTDIIMLGIYNNERDVGIYNVVQKISAVTSLTLMAINAVSAPKYAEYYAKGDVVALGKVVRKSTKMIFWTALPVLVVIFSFPSSLLGIFGEEFKYGIYALLFLTVGQFVNSFSGSVGYILQMTGKQKSFRNIIFFAALLNVVLNLCLIPRYGINGAAFSSMVSMICWNLTSAIYIRRTMGLNTFYFPVVVKV